jgi:hypothetical protein
MIRVTIADVARGTVDRLVLDWNPSDPLVVIDIDEKHVADVPAAVARLATTDRVVVGAWTDHHAPPSRALNPLLEALSVTYSAGPAANPTMVRCDVEAELAALAAVAALRPLTLRVFASVLRIVAGLRLPEAIDVESLAYSTLLASDEFASWLAQAGPWRPPPPVERAVRVHRDNDELWITFDRPERRNAFGAQLRHEFTEALKVAVADPSIVRIYVNGTGPTFCSGGDLGEFGSTRDHALSHLIRTQGGPARLIHQLSDRIEFRVHGPCVGAGVELPSLGGRTVAAAGTTFRLPEVGMGLIPGAGGTAGLTARIGRWRTFALGATGRAIDTATALEWRLIDQVVET